MAPRNQVFRNSLLRSSSSIKNIARSVTAFTSGFSAAQKSADGMSESIEEDNKFKKSLLVTDSSYFRKRQENIRRKDREDELEASTVGGAVKKSGDITQTSTRGFLGRILDFIGVLFIGWMVSTLPALIKGITSFLSKAGNMLNALRNWTGGVTDAYTRSNEELGETEQKLQGIEVQRQDAEAETNQELDATAGAFRSIGQQLSGQMQMFKDPQGFGFSESSWEKVGNINFTDKDKPPEPEKKSFSDRVGDFFWGPDKDSDSASNSISPGAVFAKDMSGSTDTPSTDTGVSTEEKPKGFMRGLTGVGDFITGNAFDLDKRGDGGDDKVSGTQTKDSSSIEGINKKSDGKVAEQISKDDDGGENFALNLSSQQSETGQNDVQGAPPPPEGTKGSVPLPIISSSNSRNNYVYTSLKHYQITAN